MNSTFSLLCEQLGVGGENDVDVAGAIVGEVNDALPLVDKLGHFAGLATLGR